MQLLLAELNRANDYYFEIIMREGLKYNLCRK